MAETSYRRKRRSPFVPSSTGRPSSVQGIILEDRNSNWQLPDILLRTQEVCYGPRWATVLVSIPHITPLSTGSPSWSSTPHENSSIVLSSACLYREAARVQVYFFNFSAEGHSSLGHCFFNHMSFPTN